MKYCEPALVDAAGAAAQRQAQHHVGQVDRLPPRCRAHLRERHVDQQQVAVADQQVGRFDVTVGQPRVPHPADDQQPVVNDRIAGVGVTQLHRTGEELGEQQVLPVRREFHKAVRLRARQPGGPAQAQRIVLLLDQPPDALERLLILEPAIQQLPAGLVPAVRAHVRTRIQLAEQVSARRPGPPQPHRAGPAGTGQPERLDAGHLDAHLVFQRASDRLTAGAAEVKMRTMRTAVNHRERLPRGEQPQPQQRHGHTQHGAEQHIGRCVHTQPHPGQANHRDDHDRGPAAAAPPPAGRHQRIQRAGQHRAHRRDLNRRHRKATPAELDQHAERQRPVHDKQDDRRQQHEHLVADHQHQQMPQPAEHDQRQQQQHIPR